MIRGSFVLVALVLWCSGPLVAADNDGFVDRVAFRAIERGDTEVLGAVRTLIAKGFMPEIFDAAVECGATGAVDDTAVVAKKVHECVETWCQRQYPSYVHTSWTIERIVPAEATPELWIAEVYVKPFGKGLSYLESLPSTKKVAVDVRTWNTYELRR